MYVLFISGLESTTCNGTTVTTSPNRPGSKAASKVSRCNFGQSRREQREGGWKDRGEIFLRAKVVNEASALFEFLWYTRERRRGEGRRERREREGEKSLKN